MESLPEYAFYPGVVLRCWCMPLGSAWSNGAAGVHSCGILRRLEWRWGVVSYC